MRIDSSLFEKRHLYPFMMKVLIYERSNEERNTSKSQLINFIKTDVNEYGKIMKNKNCILQQFYIHWLHYSQENYSFKIGPIFYVYRLILICNASCIFQSCCRFWHYFVIQTQMTHWCQKLPGYTRWIVPSSTLLPRTGRLSMQYLTNEYLNRILNYQTNCISNCHKVLSRLP